MGNTHLRQPTRDSLREYADENGHGSLDDATVALLAEHELLIVTQRKCEILEQLVRALDTGGEA